MGLTAHRGLSKKLSIAMKIKPQAAKQTVDALETIRASGNRLQFVVKGLWNVFHSTSYPHMGVPLGFPKNQSEKWHKPTTFHFSPLTSYFSTSHSNAFSNAPPLSSFTLTALTSTKNVNNDNFYPMAARSERGRALPSQHRLQPSPTHHSCMTECRK